MNTHELRKASDEYNANYRPADTTLAFTATCVLNGKRVDQIVSRTSKGGATFTFADIIDHYADLEEDLERRCHAIFARPDEKYELKFLLESLDIESISTQAKHHGIFLGGSFVMPALKYMSMPGDQHVQGWKKVIDERKLSYLHGRSHGFVHSFEDDSKANFHTLIDDESIVMPRISFPTSSNGQDSGMAPYKVGRPILYGHMVNDETLYGSRTGHAEPRVTSYLSANPSDPSLVITRNRVQYPKSAYQSCWFPDYDDGAPIFFEEHASATYKFMDSLYHHRVNTLKTCGMNFSATMKASTPIHFQLRFRIRPIIPQVDNEEVLPYLNYKSHLEKLLPAAKNNV